MDDNSISSDMTFDVDDQANSCEPLAAGVVGSMRIDAMSPAGRPSFPEGVPPPGKKKGKRKRRRRKKKGAGYGMPAPIPGLIKPTAKEATSDVNVARLREVIGLMEMKQPSPSPKKKIGGRASPDVDSLAFSDDSTLLTDEGSAGTKPNTSKSRKSTAKSSRSRGSRVSTRNSNKSSRRRKGQRNMWIDDDDVSLQSLISEMSDYDSIASSFDDNRSHVSRELGNKNLAIDDWTNVYPYNQRARPTSISERGLRMLDENMQYNDPISRPGANTAYEGIRPDRKGLTVEETFSMSQEHKILEVPALMLAPPSLPEVNSHVESEGLHLDSITGALRASKGLANLQGVSTTTVKGETKKTVADRKSDAGGFTAKEIRMVVKFIDNIGEGEGAGDGSITQDELEAAFRRGRRSQASAAQDSQGQLMVRKFAKMLGDAMTSLDAWFVGVDKNAAGKGDGRLGILEIKQGIKTLSDSIMGKSQKFTEDELISLMRYLDPSGDNELTLEEIKDGIKRSRQTPKAIREARKAGAIMCRMTDYMDENKMTIKNLFQFIDKDRSGHIVLDELRDGLTEMSTSGAEKFAKKKEGLVAARKKKEEDKRLKYDKEVKGRLMRLSETGAITVLMGLDVHMHKSGQRIIDLFGKSGFDKSGDGALGRKEFFKMLQAIGIKCSKAEVKALITIIDDSGDGEIEAYELEKIVRRYRIDNIYIREQEHAKKMKLWKRKQNKLNKVPEIEEGENDFVRMMKEQASLRDGLMRDLRRKDEDEKEKMEKERARRRNSLLPSIPKLKKKKKNAMVTSGSVLDGSWLHSFDRTLRAHARQLDK
mmetsp:Transcript_8039/g.16232  ORF Transcript_8039/g.16232 Transcript_8039/m.16232 type:complete len:820 (+) Transcript_8039:65-2524(+)